VAQQAQLMGDRRLLHLNGRGKLPDRTGPSDSSARPFAFAEQNRTLSTIRPGRLCTPPQTQLLAAPAAAVTEVAQWRRWFSRFAPTG
jgi:hypothetical protein